MAQTQVPCTVTILTKVFRRVEPRSTALYDTQERLEAGTQIAVGAAERFIFEPYGKVSFLPFTASNGVNGYILAAALDEGAQAPAREDFDQRITG